MNSIKKNLQSNKPENNINKNNKSTKHNDNSQTSSNIQNGNAHSKSPKVIEKARSNINPQSITNNIIITYSSKKVKKNRPSLPENYSSIFSSPRKKNSAINQHKLNFFLNKLI